MILIIILTILAFLVATYIAKTLYYYNYMSDYFMMLFVFGFMAAFVFGAIQLVGYNIGIKEKVVEYTVKIVSLKDNTRTEASGSLLTKVNLDERDYFSFYKVNQDGSYSIDKKIVENSVIIPDATPETSYIKITDKITSNSMKNSWWYISQDDTYRGEYLHGEFHVPANSVKNDYILDAE